MTTTTDITATDPPAETVALAPLTGEKAIWLLVDHAQHLVRQLDPSDPYQPILCAFVGNLTTLAVPTERSDG
ncbi:hypothetical protein [Patulibacter defluvii]|uniref:hypothetical protein n=1 Tax=Patulibacter defluvii TaxID=3095358 RepID=UPI002A7593A7|nr:hypothetical protein [Patulibacter sp. DM4]